MFVYLPIKEAFQSEGKQTKMFRASVFTSPHFFTLRRQGTDGFQQPAQISRIYAYIYMYIHMFVCMCRGC